MKEAETALAYVANEAFNMLERVRKAEEALRESRVVANPYGPGNGPVSSWEAREAKR